MTRAQAILAATLLQATLALADVAPKDDLGQNEGVVLEIDRKAGEIAIRHGYLPELSMDAMSMYFHVADPALFGRVRKGDRVKFKAGLVEGRFAVIAIERLGPARRRTRDTRKPD